MNEPVFQRLKMTLASSPTVLKLDCVTEVLFYTPPNC